LTEFSWNSAVQNAYCSLDLLKIGFYLRQMNVMTNEKCGIRTNIFKKFV